MLELMSLVLSGDVSMQLLKTEGEFVILVYNPAREQIRVGESIAVIDRRERHGVVIQVVEISVPDLPGILLNIIRREAAETEIVRHRPEDIAERYHAVENMKYGRARIMRELHVDTEGGLRYERWTGYVPSRNVEFQTITESDLISALRASRA